jgi:hypothetical protein
VQALSVETKHDLGPGLEPERIADRGRDDEPASFAHACHGVAHVAEHTVNGSTLRLFKRDEAAPRAPESTGRR